MMDHVIKKQDLVNKKQIKMVKQASTTDYEKILGDLNQEMLDAEKDKKIATIKRKIMSVARFNLMLKKEKENAEFIAKAKQAYPDHKLPAGSILDGFENVNEYLHLKKQDSENEKFPLAVYRRNSEKNLFK